MGAALQTDLNFRPVAPIPLKKDPNLAQRLYKLYANPIELWTERHFRELIATSSLGLGSITVVSDPAGVRRVLLDNSANYGKGELQLRLLAPALGQGLLTSEGENWRFQRRALAASFTPRQVASFAPAMSAVAQTAVARLRVRQGQGHDMHAEMARVTLETLERTLFTQGLQGQASEFYRAVGRYFETAGRIDPLDVLGVSKRFPRIGRMRAQPTLNWFRSVVDSIIQTRRAVIDQGGDAPSDILTLLLRAKDPETGQGMDEETVRANITTFIGAGHETTANALTWTLYLLSQSPQWREHAQAEADAQLHAGPIETLVDRAPILKAILEESMRLYPPAAILSRQAITPDAICGHKVKARANIVISPYVMHRHRMLWDDPDHFDPNRFLGQAREKIDRFAYIPFGAGPRICIGMGFAMHEMTIILSHFLHAFTFDLVAGQKIRAVQHITLRPERGVIMKISPRG